MNLNRMTEIYRHGGREGLISAIEEFSVASRAELLAEINTRPEARSANESRRVAYDSQSGSEDCCF